MAETVAVREEPVCGLSLLDAIRQIIADQPDIPFLALGQTIFWDEPLKAVVRLGLDQVSPRTPLVLAVHDTDYFARPHATLASSQPYLILPHNGGSTQNLWCAAGELSRLFGAETIPGRAALRAAGARLDVAARARGESLHDFIDRVTEAWGWRGIVQTSGVETLTHEVQLEEVLESLLLLLDWGFSTSAETLCHCTGTAQADALASRLRSALLEAADSLPGGSLSDLYRKLFPQMYELITGESHSNIRVSHSMGESRFHPGTANLPRFRIVDLFLRPESREICIQAYNNAVEGSEIYTLEQFGEGSIPFDLVTPEGGRGTLRILEEGICVEGRRPDFIPTKKRVETVMELAEVVTGHYKDEVHLVGKAITWISILAAEFRFIFHEGASSYTRRTRQMLQEMRRRGVSLDLNPILRVRYNTWDALEVVTTGFCLPDHYAEAFGTREIPAREFASRWRQVMDEQEALLLELGKLRRPVDLLYFLEGRDKNRWGPLLRDYLAARNQVRASNALAPEYRREAQEIRETHYRCGIEIDQLRKQLGDLRRRRIHGSPTGSPEVGFTEVGSTEVGSTGVDPGEQEAVEQERRHVLQDISKLEQKRQALVVRRANLRQGAATARGSEEYQTALSTLRSIEGEAELERVRLARNAYLVAHSLENSNRRPTAWWLPMVSPDGGWFRAICRTATAYIEEL